MKPWLNGPLAKTWLTAGALSVALTGPAYLHRLFKRDGGVQKSDRAPVRISVAGPSPGFEQSMGIIVLPLAIVIAGSRFCGVLPQPIAHLSKRH